MAGLDASARSILETWLGQISAGDKPGEETDLANRIGRLGAPEAVALEVLLMRRAEMVLSATKVAGDDVRSDHTENLKPLSSLIDELVTAIRADDDITLNTAAEALVARAEAGSGDSASVIDVVANAARRG